MNRLGALALLVFAVLIAACTGGGTSQKTDNPSDVGAAPAPEPEVAVDLPASAAAQIKALVEEKAARTPAQRKISSQLLYATTERFAALKRPLSKGEPPQPAGLRSLLRYDDRGRVLCDIKGDVDAGLARQIEIAGGTVVVTSVEHRSARAWLPLQSLEALAAQPIVRTIRPALAAATNRADAPYNKEKFPSLSYEQRVASMQKALRALGPAVADKGSVTSAGSKAHAADRARKFFNTDGSGIKIGVLADSNDFLEQSIASGDLPGDVFTLPGESGRPGSGEGTALMEIIHDVAPGAKLFFATSFTSPESFADNIRLLYFVYGCNIIVDGTFYFFESPYEDDIIAQAVNDVTAGIGTAPAVSYFSAAGDAGNFSDGTSGVWEGDFKSGGVLATIGANYRVHDFGKKVISNRVEVGGGPLMLHWSDPGALDNPASENDYDLFVLSEDLRTVLAAATDIQEGIETPFEFLGVFVPANMRIVVAANPAAQTRAIRVQLWGGELGLSTSGAVVGHAAATDAFAVGAVDAASAGNPEFIAGPVTPVELTSSDGNRTIFYDTDNTQFGTGNPTFAGAAGVLRRKPEAVAADGVATTLPSEGGLNPLFGTMAAAAHAAGIAALIKSAVPTADKTKVYNALKNGALDIEAAGVDVDSGHGVLSAFNGLQKAGAKPAYYLELGTVTATPTGGGVIKPGDSAVLNVQILNNGGAAANAVNAILSTSTPGVTITTATSAYPNMAPSAVATNTTPFAFNLSPSVLCGLRIDFTLTVSSGGRATPLRFTVQTGGTGASIVTSYAAAAVPIPDNDSAGVNIALTVTGAGLLSALSLRIDGTSCTATPGATTVGVDHTFVGDLRFRLHSPIGTPVLAIDRAGGAGNVGNNFCQTVLLDGAPNSIQNVTIEQAPFVGTFAPANPLRALAGENANGTWTLNVSDVNPLDTGNVRAFSLVTTGFSCTP